MSPDMSEEERQERIEAMRADEESLRLRAQRHSETPDPISEAALKTIQIEAETRRKNAVARHERLYRESYRRPSE